MPKAIKFSIDQNDMQKIVAVWPGDGITGEFVKKADEIMEGKVAYTEHVPKLFQEKYGVLLSNKNSAKFHKSKVAMYFT